MLDVLAKSRFKKKKEKNNFFWTFPAKLGVLGAVAPFVQRPAEAHHQQDLCPRLPRHGEPRLTRY